jgi:hypothetical protein
MRTGLPREDTGILKENTLFIAFNRCHCMTVIATHKL